VLDVVRSVLSCKQTKYGRLHRLHVNLKSQTHTTVYHDKYLTLWQFIITLLTRVSQCAEHSLRSLIFKVHCKHSDWILCAFQTFGHILAPSRNVLHMLKTFEVHFKWRNIERHLKCILTALLVHSKYAGTVLHHSISIRNIPVSFEGESTWQATSNLVECPECVAPTHQT